MLKSNNFKVPFNDTPFLVTSNTSAAANRLNWRAEILLTQRQKLIHGKRILDIASHDGRFSYACLKLGAKHVRAVEGRLHLVKNAKNTFSKYNFDSSSYDLVCSDIFTDLPLIQPGTIDTVLCLGFFYHTLKQAELLEQIIRIKPRHIILDTNTFIAPFDTAKKSFLYKLLSFFQSFGWTHPVLKYLDQGLIDNNQLMVLRKGEPNKDAYTIDSRLLRAVPTKEALEFLLKNYGFKIEELDWHNSAVNNWESMDDYKKKQRLSYVLELP